MGHTLCDVLAHSKLLEKKSSDLCSKTVYTGKGSFDYDDFHIELQIYLFKSIPIFQ